MTTSGVNPEKGRQCKQCEQWKHASEFSWKLRGYRLAARCHSCRRENYKEDPKKAKERSREYYANNRDTVLSGMKERRRMNVPRELVKQARKRAKVLGVPFNLEESDIVVPDKCPVLGIEIFVNDGKSGPNSPTIDRVVGDRGYTKGNVIVVSHRANTIKSDADIDELRRVVKFYEQYV